MIDNARRHGGIRGRDDIVHPVKGQDMDQDRFQNDVAIKILDVFGKVVQIVQAGKTLREPGIGYLGKIKGPVIFVFMKRPQEIKPVFRGDRSWIKMDRISYDRLRSVGNDRVRRIKGDQHKAVRWKREPDVLHDKSTVSLYEIIDFIKGIMAVRMIIIFGSRIDPVVERDGFIADI